MQHIYFTSILRPIPAIILVNRHVQLLASERVSAVSIPVAAFMRHSPAFHTHTTHKRNITHETTNNTHDTHTHVVRIITQINTNSNLSSNK